jgi:rubrerythrin
MRSFLADCKRIEEIAGKIYQKLAADESYANEVRTVFQKLSDDEKAHARHIDLVLQANEKELSVTPLIPDEKLDAVLTTAEYLLRKVDREELNEETSLRLAVHLEQEFTRVHINNALFFNNQKLTELFDKLGREDEEHLNTLKDCLKWWHAERKQLLRGD